MKNIYLISTLAFLLFSFSTVYAQTKWTGPTINFVKADSADWTMEANQDRITDSVWITRAHSKSIFNVKSETDYTNFLSPKGTEWSYGTMSMADTLKYVDFQTVNGGNPASMIDKDMVLHLIKEDIYIDLKFTSFSGGTTKGGGFAYTRSTEQKMSVNNLNSTSKLSIYPNPASNQIQVSGLTTVTPFKIVDILGQEVLNGQISNNELIEIDNLRNGFYFLKLEDTNIIKFLKQ